MIIIGELVDTNSEGDLKYGLCVNSYSILDKRYVTLIFEDGCTQDYSADEQNNLESHKFIEEMRGYKYDNAQKLSEDYNKGVFEKFFK